MEQGVKYSAFCHFIHTSSPSSLYYPPPLSLRVSSTELHKVLDSLLNQIDWLEVTMQAGKGRAPSIYCNTIQKILQAQISQLAEAENKLQGRNRGDREDVHVYEGDNENEDEGEEEEDSDTEVEDSAAVLMEGTDTEEDEEDDEDYEAVEEAGDETDEYDDGGEMEDDSEYE